MSPFPRPDYQPLEPYAPDRRPIPVDLSDNTNRWGTHPKALEAVRRADPDDLLRYPPVYADRLKDAIVRHFDIPPESVSTGCGSDDLLDSTFRAAGVGGEGVVYMPPTFSMIEIFARMNGMSPLPVNRPGDPGPPSPFGPLPDPERLLERDPALIYLCRPNNPTGEVHPRAWVEELLAAVGSGGPIVLLDEAYADFMAGPVDDFLREAATSHRLLVLRTLSKAYGLAGLRVGFAVGAPQIIREVEKSRGPYKVNRLAETAAVAAIADDSGWIQDICNETRVQRDRLVGELDGRGLPCLPSGGNFVLIPLAPHTPSAPSLTVPPAADTVTAALRDRGVGVRPFPALPGLGDAIRVSIGPAHEMNAFLNALDELLI